MTPGFENVVIDCIFTDSLGDIDIQLVDSAGVVVTGSYSSTDDESIDVFVAGPGTYYIRVYPFGGGGNTYDLWWDDLAGTMADDDDDICGCIPQQAGTPTLGNVFGAILSWLPLMLLLLFRNRHSFLRRATE